MEPEYTPEQREYLDKLPYMQLICKRIDDIDNAINRGLDGVYQAENLLTDLPSRWLLKIKPSIAAQKTIITQREAEINKKANSYGTKTKDDLILNIRLEYTRFIKTSVIDVLDDNRMLFATRPTAPELSYNLYEEEKQNEQQ